MRLHRCFRAARRLVLPAGDITDTRKGEILLSLQRELAR